MHYHYSIDYESSGLIALTYGPTPNTQHVSMNDVECIVRGRRETLV